MGRRLNNFREEWDAAGKAIDRNNAAREKQEAKKAKVKPTAAEIAIMNDATIAGNVANSVVNN